MSFLRYLVIGIVAGSWLFPLSVYAGLQKIQLEKADVQPVEEDNKQFQWQVPEWVVKAGRLYMKQKNAAACEDLLQILEKQLGVEKDGTLDLRQAWQSKKDLSLDFDEAFKEVSGTGDTWIKAGVTDSAAGDTSWRYYLKNKLSLIGFNYIYFELCTKYQDAYKERFIRYFENGFYPNRSLFSQNSNYYRSLYYYLYLTTSDISRKFNRATVFLNKHPRQAPRYILEEDLERFQMLVSAASELDLFISQKMNLADALYEKVFSEKERAWLKKTLDYYLSTDTHTALLSYRWFRRNMPLEASAHMISHDILKTWEKQATIERSRLPLMFFGEKGGTRVSIEEVFKATLEKLRLDNRKVDIMVLTALKSWLAKQVQRGIRIDDRKTYNRILAELKVCPTGWIFANLYDCRTHLGKLQGYVDNWENHNNKKQVFKSRVMDAFFAAKEKIDRIFGDLEKIYGKEQKGDRINHIFYKYRGEMRYCFKYLQFETFNGEGGVVPAAGPEANYLADFKAAFVACSDERQNHINLLKGYHLLFRKLYADGRIEEIRRREREMESLVNGELELGSGLDHQENELYDIYRLLTFAYLSSPELEVHALETARKGFVLARDYYLKAASKAGYSADGSFGAITTDNTVMDDYQRQFELYRRVAGKLGKNIQLLVPDRDIRLYNRIQEMRFQGKYLQ